MTGPRLDPVRPISERIAAWRTYRGLSQEVCADLMDRSPQWWRRVESGTASVGRFGDLVLVAQILQVEDVTDLTGGREIGRSLDRTREDRLLPRMRRAVLDAVEPCPPDPFDHEDHEDHGNRHGGAGRDPLAGTDGRTRYLDLLRARLDEGWSVWNQGGRQITGVGESLPPLLLDAAAARVHARGSEERRRAALLLSEAYLLACCWFGHAHHYDLAWTSADRATSAAGEAGDPLAVALGLRAMGVTLRDMGRPEECERTFARGERLLEPLLAGPDHLSAWGQVHLDAALAAAHCSDDGAALRHWEAADEAARRLGPAHSHHPATAFGQPAVALYAIRAWLALGRSADALTAADRLDMATVPSVPLRAQGLIDIARAYAWRSDDVAALHVLLRAEEESPDTVAHSVEVHEMTRALLRRGRSVIQDELRGFAVRTGVVVVP